MKHPRRGPSLGIRTLSARFPRVAQASRRADLAGTALALVPGQEVPAMFDIPTDLGLIPDAAMLNAAFDAGVRLSLEPWLWLAGVACLVLFALTLLGDEEPERVADAPESGAYREAA
jgi:hypothetical protein